MKTKIALKMLECVSAVTAFGLMVYLVDFDLALGCLFLIFASLAWDGI